MTARSPVFSHTTASIEGLTTIRAFAAERMLINEFDHHQNANSSAYFLFVATTRGFAFWIDLISTFYVAAVVFSFLILGSGMISNKTMALHSDNN